jgi:hypothetical protein
MTLIRGFVESDLIENHWKLVIEWSGERLRGLNELTFSMYLVSVGERSEILSTSYKQGCISVEDDEHIINSRFGGEGLANIESNDKKLLHKFTKFFKGNSIEVSGHFDIVLTLLGNYYEHISIPKKSFRMKTVFNEFHKIEE